MELREMLFGTPALSASLAIFFAGVRGEGD